MESRKGSLLLPLNVPNHQMGLLLTPTSENNASCVLFNTGMGTDKNHPSIEGGKKIQTALEMSDVPIAHLLCEKTWNAIYELKHEEIDALYPLVMGSLCEGGVQNWPSEEIYDYEAPQHMGSCFLQHIQAFIRYQFMSCEELGNKRARYAAYRIVISDFALFVGNKRFANSSEEPFFFAWNEKKEKLEAILNLSRQIEDLEYFCTLLDKVRGLENVEVLSQHEEAFYHLQKTYQIYRNQLRLRAIEEMQTMRLEDLPARASVNVVRTHFKDETLEIVKSRLEEFPDLMQKFQELLHERSSPHAFH